METLSDLTLRLAVWLQLTGAHVRRGARTTVFERGQGMVEYGLILALVAIGAIAVLVLMGDQITGIFTDTKNQLSTARTPTP